MKQYKKRGVIQMSWTCPNLMKDKFCGLRKMECEPRSDGCILSNKFQFIELDEDNLIKERDEKAFKKQKKSKK